MQECWLVPGNVLVFELTRLPSLRITRGWIVARSKAETLSATRLYHRRPSTRRGSNNNPRNSLPRSCGRPVRFRLDIRLVIAVYLCRIVLRGVLVIRRNGTARNDPSKNTIRIALFNDFLSILAEGNLDTERRWQLLCPRRGSCLYWRPRNVSVTRILFKRLVTVVVSVIRSLQTFMQIYIFLHMIEQMVSTYIRSCFTYYVF